MVTVKKGIKSFNIFGMDLLFIVLNTTLTDNLEERLRSG